MTTEEFKRRLTAILNADVAGYNRLMRNDEEATIHTLTSYRNVMTNLILQYRGRVVDSPDDNILAEFTSVVDAVNCGVEIQRDLAERNAELPENRRMQFRIGINLGDVLEERKRIYGGGVNIDARMESVAEAGEICNSGTVYDAIENKIGLEYEYLGEQEVKNIDKPVRAYRVLSIPDAAAHRVIKAKRAVERTWRKTAFAMAAVLVIAVGSYAIWNYAFRAAPPSKEVVSEKSTSTELSEKLSIAVLPFVNMNDDPKQEYFSDGISEDLITDLSKIPGLLVISRNSSFTCKGKSIKTQQIEEELGVRYMLEGSVRKADNRVRINAQLIDSTTGHHLWAKRYDGSIHDIFTLQDKITQKIVTTLAVKLTDDEQERLGQKETNNIEAYDAFLKGSDLARDMSLDGYARAVPWFEKAIELDPNYGRAYAALAETYCYGTWVGLHRKLGISWRQARLWSSNYLQLAMKNPTNIAHRTASILFYSQHQHEKAIDEAERLSARSVYEHQSQC
jgi:TolB-like protein/class 3 adenylate cyclase